MHARAQVPTLGTPDLVVVCKGKAIDWVIIENKLNALEGKDQTRRYASPRKSSPWPSSSGPIIRLTSRSSCS